MLPALGHCEDPDCQSTSPELLRIFRCTIHCDRNLCLYHLNTHNVNYEEEKKQNNLLINDLQNHLTLYQTIFEKQIVAYRELVRKASAIILHNTSSLVPMEQIQPVLEKLQQAIALFHQEKIVIKCEATLETSELENKSIKTPNNNVCMESGQEVVVRITRIDCNQNNTQPENENPLENDENAIKFPDNGQEQRNSSPAYVTRKVKDQRKKRNSSVKRLQK